MIAKLVKSKGCWWQIRGGCALLVLCLGMQLVVAQNQPTPFKGSPVALPGFIEAEDFDNGGEGISYHDTSPGNDGGGYRNTDVDIFADAAAGNGFMVRFSTNEWLTYTVVVGERGYYDAYARIKTLGNYGGGQFNLQWGNSETNSTIQIPVIAFMTPNTALEGIIVTGDGYIGLCNQCRFFLAEGTNTLRVSYTWTGTFPGSDLKLDWIQILPSVRASVETITGSAGLGFSDGPLVSAKFSDRIGGLALDHGFGV